MSIDLSGNLFSDVTGLKSVFELNSLKQLMLEWCHIKCLPVFDTKKSKLELLYITGNDFDTDSISMLSQLKGVIQLYTTPKEMCSVVKRIVNINMKFQSIIDNSQRMLLLSGFADDLLTTNVLKVFLKV